MRFLLVLIATLSILSWGGTCFAVDVDFQVYTSSYAYNGENTHWEQTRTTLTYFENFTEALFDIKFNEIIDVQCHSGSESKKCDGSDVAYAHRGISVSGGSIYSSCQDYYCYQ